MKILLAGASGLLGAAVAKAAARRRHEVIGIVGSYEGAIDGLASQCRADLLDHAKTERLALDCFPDAIVNCAALAAAGDCDINPMHSQRLNVELPEQLAQLARHLFASCIHISSDLVFDGAQAPYSPDDCPSPLSLYGTQKAEADKRVLKAYPQAIALRLPLLNGNSPRGNRSLHEKLLEAWSQEKPTTLYQDEIRQPCLADNTADAIVEICERDDISGQAHWAGSEALSRREIGLRLLRHFGLPEKWSIPGLRESAKRPANLAMDLQPLQAKLKTQPMSFDEQLASLNIPEPLQAWYNAL